MLPFRHITLSKRVAEERHTVKEGYILSPIPRGLLLLPEKGSRPSTCFSITIQTISIFCQPKLFNTDYSLSTFKHFPRPRNPKLKSHTCPTFRTKTNFSSLSRGAAAHRYHNPAYLASRPSKWVSLIVTTNTSLGLWTFNIPCRVLTGADFTVLVHVQQVSKEGMCARKISSDCYLSSLV